MTLEYSYLSEVFPDYGIEICEDNPPEYRNPFSVECSHLSEVFPEYRVDKPYEYRNPFELIRDLKPYEKLRIVDGRLEIDRRKFQSIVRKYTGDSRWKILEKLLEYDYDDYLHILRTSTYSKDKKWVEMSKRHLNKKLA